MSSQGALDAIETFGAVAAAQSFTAAAERMGMTKAAVSLQVRRLEARLGTQLLLRTTRSVRLTAAGEALYKQCMPALAVLNDALARAGTPGGSLEGTLRVAAPSSNSAHAVATALADFAALHPRLQVALFSADRPLDLVTEGIDVAMRFGRLRDSSLRAVRLAEFEEVLIASPDYLRRKGLPHHPQDLASHDWVAFTLMATPLTWTFTGPRGERVTVRMRSRMQVDAPAALAELVTRGAGITVMHSGAVAGALRDGSLVRLLAEWHLPRGGVYAVYPHTRTIPVHARAFIDFYRAFLEKAPTH